MTRKCLRKAIFAALLTVLTLLLGGFLFILAQTNQKPSPLPHPNGYDDFAKAGQLLVGDAKNISKLTGEKLQQFVTDNQAALQLVKAGLGKDCRVPTEYSQHYLQGHLHDMVNTRKLAQAIKAEGALAEQTSRTNDAVEIYLDGIRFGLAVCRGGLLIDRLFGNACEALNEKPLSALIPSLNAHICRQAAEELVNIDAKEEPIAEMLENEKRWSQRRGVTERVIGLILYRFKQSAIKPAVAKSQQVRRQRRQLIIDLAAHAYELDQHQAPANTQQLVPQYLKAVPVDPETETPLKLSLGTPITPR